MRAVEAAVIALAGLPERDRDAALVELLELGLHTVASTEVAVPPEPWIRELAPGDTNQESTVRPSSPL
jgi:hypothetical protein